MSPWVTENLFAKSGVGTSSVSDLSPHVEVCKCGFNFTTSVETTRNILSDSFKIYIVVSEVSTPTRLFHGLRTS